MSSCKQTADAMMNLMIDDAVNILAATLITYLTQYLDNQFKACTNASPRGSRLTSEIRPIGDPRATTSGKSIMLRRM